MNGILKRKTECAACLKYSVLIFVEKIYKMKHLEGSGTPVLYIYRRLNILDFNGISAPNFIFLDVINIRYYHCTYSVSFVVQNVNRKKT
jgi:hypothetical protein